MIVEINCQVKIELSGINSVENIGATQLSNPMSNDVMIAFVKLFND